MNIIIYPDPEKEFTTYEKVYSNFDNFDDLIFTKFKDTEIESLEISFNNNIKNINSIFIFKNDYCQFVSKNINFILNNKTINFYIFEGDHHYLSSKPNTYKRFLLLRENLKKNNHIYILSTYWYHYSKLYEINKQNLISFPAFVKNEHFEINYKPTMKVLLSGSITKHYPMRKYLKSLNLPNIHLMDSKIRLPLEEYKKFISQFVCSFTCCLNKNTPYIIGKFFEIPITGSLLLAYDEYVKEPLKKLGFIDGINYIGCNKKNILEKINWICDVKNLDEINKIREKGKELILNNHSIENRYEFLKSLALKSLAPNMYFYNKNTINNIDIDYPDIYFTPEYGLACEFSDNAIWELCKYKDLIYVYLKKPIKYESKTYYDLITPYGYSGYHYEKKETYIEFLPIFRKIAKEKNYVTEVLRQNPYLNINITEYDIITSKTVYGIKISDFDYYFKNVLNVKKRNMYQKALKKNLHFDIIKLENNMLEKKFINLYNENMKKVNAFEYFYFNKNYFNSLEKINNSYLAVIKDNLNNIIGCSIIFKYKKYFHYHLSCNNNSSNCITDFLLINIVNKFGVNKSFILGGGLKDGDSLSKFKKKLSNTEFEYTIYKNILNKEIYDKLCQGQRNDFFPSYRK